MTEQAVHALDTPGLDQQAGAFSSFSLQLVQRTLEETLGAVQKSIHEDVRNLHIDLIRQFHMQEVINVFFNFVLTDFFHCPQFNHLFQLLCFFLCFLGIWFWLDDTRIIGFNLG